MRKARVTCASFVVVCAGLAWVGGCSGGGASNPPADATTEATHDATDATRDAKKDASADAPPDAKTEAASRHDSGRDASDAASDVSVTGTMIVSPKGAPLQAAPGDALQLEVVYTLSDGTTEVVPSGSVTWTSPVTIAAADPNDAGSASGLPDAGTQPTAFFISNMYRIDHAGALFVIDQGTASPAEVKVTASVSGSGSVSATVTILPAPVGDPVNGQKLYQSLPLEPCLGCHGMTGTGSPPVDAGKGVAEYKLPMSGGSLYPYPAPGLNDAPDSGNLATDPAWSAALLGMAAQSDMDNHGVALRAPMPVYFAASDGTGKTMGAQDFADIYAWLETQTK